MDNSEEKTFFFDEEETEIFSKKTVTSKKNKQERVLYRPAKKVKNPPKTEEVNSYGAIKETFEWLEVIVTSLIAVVIIFTFFFRIVAIEGNSMKNTLIDGERVVVTNLFYTPEKGDIVVISRNTENSAVTSNNQKPIIKRIIATEGDLVDIDFEQGIVYVNGVALNEEYIREKTYRFFDVEFPVRVPEDCVFVMGDNRNDSLDSRSTQIGDNGMVNKKYILGHAVCRVYPLNKLGGLN